MKPADSADIELESLIALFYDDVQQVGQIELVDAEKVTQPSRQLLDHEHHMTVTVERFHGCPVDVQVLQSRIDGDHYSRKILLTRHRDGKVVQFGIVRMDRTQLAKPVREAIESQEVPLGRILIENDVLRRVKLVGLCKVSASKEVAGYFGCTEGEVLFGRTALIYCDGQPAIELLEIVGGFE